MWGNLQGWIISAAIALGMGYLFYTVAAPPSPTDPTNSGKLTIANGPITLAISPESLVAAGTQDGDAGDSYRKSIDDYTQNAQPYESFLNGGQMKVKEDQMPAVADILAARDLKNFNLFSGKNLTKIVNYENNEPDLQALGDLGNICCTLGLLYTKEAYNPQLQLDKALKLWEAAFVLGTHLYNERATWEELRQGHSLIQTAGDNLRNYYKDKKDPKADRFDEFLAAEGANQLKITEAFKIIGGIDESYAGKYAGDIFKIAQNTSADGMFRVEAVKHIGHYRYNSLTSGDQLKARKVLKNMLEDKSLPANVNAAVNAAHDLTLAEHNKVGGGSGT